MNKDIKKKENARKKYLEFCKKRQEDCLKVTCERILNCKVEDISEEFKKALIEMYMWGTSKNGYDYPQGLEYT